MKDKKSFFFASADENVHLTESSNKPALISCEVCGGKVASDAEKCCSCGHPIRVSFVEAAARGMVAGGFAVLILASIAAVILFIVLKMPE